MKQIAVLLAALILAGCQSVAPAARAPESAAAAAEVEAATEAAGAPTTESGDPASEEDEALLDTLTWLATPPDLTPAADAAMEAWLAQRTAVLEGQVPEGEALDWHRQVRADWQAAAETEDAFAAEIKRRVALDQYGRFSVLSTPDEAAEQAARLGVDLSPDDRQAFQERLFRSLMGQDVDNTDFLRRALEARGGRWWTISEVGSDLSGKIWLIVQHADLHRDFQKQALALMEPLLEAGEINRNNYAYLWDRVAVAEDRPQRFGTQGQCVAPGSWEPAEIEAPVEAVDQRRADMDISVTSAENKRRLDQYC